MEYTVGQHVGDYEVLEILGAGGMGRVYKVRNIISQRVEAMKVLLADLSSSPELFDRFLREIRTLAALQHPNIAGLHTALRHDNQILMLMEFVEGESLDKMMRRGRVPMPQVVELTRETLSALHYAHQNGVVHRDIKPANIMVDKSGRARLTDFGIALAARDQRMTQTGRTLGSLFYMSPEQIQGEGTIDGRSDLYSLGVTLYEMATGSRPFQGESDFSIMAAHLHSPPKPPSELDAQVPAPLNQIILTSMAKDPAQRFQTADAMRLALGHVFGAAQHEGETTALPAQPPPPVVHAPTVKQTAPPPQAGNRPPAPPQPVNRPPAPPQQMKQGSGARVLWLVAGSLVTIAVLVIAAIQVPKVRSILAGPQDPVQTATSPVKSSSAEQPAPAVSKGDVQPEPTPAPPPPVPTPAPAQVAQQQPPAPKPQNVPGQVAPAPAPATGTPTPYPVQTPSVQPPSTQPAPPPVAPPANSAAIREQRDRLVDIATRTGPIRRSLDRLRQQQARAGLGLRRDFDGAESRLVNLLDDAEAELKRGNAVGAEKYLDSAEISLRFLETNLGR